MPPSDLLNLIDISVAVSPEMPIYPGDPEVRFETPFSIESGDIANLTCLHLGAHTGTHFDAPHHILNNNQTVKDIPLSACYGPIQVINIPDDIQAIDAAVLQNYELSRCERLLLKTRNSAFWQSHPHTFRTDYAALTEDGATYLAALGIQLVGIDYLSIELYHAPPGLKAHRALLEKNIAILEGLNLADVPSGTYTLAAFPIRYDDLDGAPARAVLIRG